MSFKDPKGLPKTIEHAGKWLTAECPDPYTRHYRDATDDEIAAAKVELARDKTLVTVGDKTFKTVQVDPHTVVTVGEVEAAELEAEKPKAKGKK